jgi:hypothetical protein
MSFRADFGIAPFWSAPRSLHKVGHAPYWVRSALNIGRIRPFSGHKRIEHMNASPVDNSLNAAGLQIKDEAGSGTPT